MEAQSKCQDWMMATPSFDIRVRRPLIAWPTLLLAVFCFVGLWFSTSAVLEGALAGYQGVLLHILLFYLAFTPMHDAAHGAISGGRSGFGWVDSVVGWSCCLLFFSPFAGFRRLHRRHHSATNDPRRDPDYWVASARPLGVLFRCLSIIPHYYRFFLASGGFGGRSHNTERSYSTAVFAGMMATVAAFLTSPYAEQFLFLWLLPALIASSLIAFCFQWLPHHPHRRRGRYKSTRLIEGWGLHWLLVAQDLHLVHHLYPQVPFYRYRSVYEHIRADLTSRGVPKLRLWWGRF